uniref:Uncharacterized protein n=1 Tax=viral metagenome TaxID=1070528 RepID=A0A6C0AEM5_9ZZZZ
MQCFEITKKGDRCKNTVLNECGFCTRHYNIRKKEGRLEKFCDKSEKQSFIILLTDEEILEKYDIKKFLQKDKYIFGKYKFNKDDDIFNIKQLSTSPVQINWARSFSSLF